MSKFSPEIDEEAFAGGTMSALTVAFSIAGGCLLEGSDSFIANLLMAVIVIGVAFLLSGMVMLIGILIYRIVLGNDGINSPSKIRTGLCLAALVILVAAMLSGM